MPTLRLMLLSAMLCSWQASAENAAPELAYLWKSGDLFRFDYSKTITTRQPNEDGRIEDRQTEMAAVLIIEIKSVTASGAAATLRFDSPRVTLPTIRFFSAQADDVELQPEKTRAIARAMEGAIKTARWAVLLKPDGAIHIEARTPATLNDWMKETGNASGWRKKSQDAMLELLEQDLGLKAHTVDRETLVCLSPAAAPAAVSSAEALHPLRTAIAVTRKDDKAQLSFQRVFDKQQSPYIVPQLTARNNIKVQVESVASTEGIAVFDTKIGSVDTLSEDYTAKVRYESGKETLAQEVRVQYKLKRLAPAIVKNE